MNGKKWPKLAILHQKRPVFSGRKAKKIENYVKSWLKSSLSYAETISWWTESSMDVSWPTEARFCTFLFLDPYIFPYKIQKNENVPFTWRRPKIFCVYKKNLFFRKMKVQTIVFMEIQLTSLLYFCQFFAPFPHGVGFKDLRFAWNRVIWNHCS